jgi:UDP-N-acetylmuramoyl-L-alanyl-D-glutamate--2,6-diaminopimelate ligase
MSYKFEDLEVVDNTLELDSNRVFLLTGQNRKYFNKDFSYLTPKELIKKFKLDDIKIIGITGTNGKTTTAAAIYSILNDLGYKSALQGTRGFFINDEKIKEKSLTTPPILETLSNLYRAKKEGAKFFVMEVSSHAISQNRIEDLEFFLKVFTNISQDHLDYHKNMKNYIYTKSSFFSDEGLKLINKDDKHIKYNLLGARTYGIENMATYKIEAYSLDNGISGVLNFANSLYDFFSPLMGLFNLYNITAAISAVHMATNEDLKKITEAVENFGGVKGRMEVVSYEPLVIVDFAHTPDGMQKVFESFPYKNIVALFGAGGNRDRDKRAKMGSVASRFCKKIYLTSDNLRDEEAEEIINDIKAGIKTGVETKVIVDRQEAIKEAISSLKKGDVLLVLGKGDEEYMEIRDKKYPFNDVKIIKKFLNENL